MDLKIISEGQKDEYNNLVIHITQSFEWGEFRQKLGLPVLRYGLYQNNEAKQVFQLTLHKIPLFNKYIGYLPKGPYPDKNLADALEKIGKEYNCIAIKIEANIEIQNSKSEIRNIDKRFKPSSKEVFTKFNSLIDLTLSEEELLKNMHPKTRYNIKVAQKHGVWIEQRVDDEAFEIYLKLYFETVSRQKYFGHNKTFHRLLWQTLSKKGLAKILIAFYRPPDQKEAIPLTSWMLFNFKDTLYYPYGGSSQEYKNVMATYLVAWEAIKLGKKEGLKQLDLWGILNPSVSPNHPWYGFHNFKIKLGGKVVEYLGTYDLIFNKPLFLLFTKVDKMTRIKALLLKLLRK